MKFNINKDFALIQKLLPAVFVYWVLLACSHWCCSARSSLGMYSNSHSAPRYGTLCPGVSICSVMMTYASRIDLQNGALHCDPHLSKPYVAGRSSEPIGSSIYVDCITKDKSCHILIDSM